MAKLKHALAAKKAKIKNIKKCNKT